MEARISSADQVDIEIRRDTGLYLVQEPAALGCAVLRIACADDMARGDIERREERCRAMAYIVMGAFGDLAGPHREQGLALVKYLYLQLFIDAQHDLRQHEYRRRYDLGRPRAALQPSLRADAVISWSSP